MYFVYTVLISKMWPLYYAHKRDFRSQVSHFNQLTEFADDNQTHSLYYDHVRVKVQWFLNFFDWSKSLRDEVNMIKHELFLSWKAQKIIIIIIVVMFH